MTKKIPTDWQTKIATASSALGAIDEAIKFLSEHRDAATAEIAQYLRSEISSAIANLDLVISRLKAENKRCAELIEEIEANEPKP